MKKSLRKPENWQDFESLCKKLWGELWNIQTTIKKHGRSGQDQAGVDVYGIPDGKSKYWGIQCKGKDDYTSSKIKESEIVNEVEKAKLFRPSLGCFIIATTSNKDVKIEEFVRLLNEKQKEQESFEILLYCWEDITDLIEENHIVLNWYLHGSGQKGTFDFKISFNDKSENLVLKPTYRRNIIKYELSDKSDIELALEKTLIIKKPDVIGLQYFTKLGEIDANTKTTLNKSKCSFDLVMENIGASVIEDWRFTIKFIQGVDSLDYDKWYKPFFSLNIQIHEQQQRIVYSPYDKTPLIQNDNRYFNVEFIPNPYSAKLVAEWELLARDFSRNGTLEIYYEPEYIDEIFIEEVNNVDDLLEDEISISYYYSKK